MTLRVAVVGAGPKGLHALERLIGHLREHPPQIPVQIDVFEPSVPGAGPAYAPTLPHAVLMNLRSDLVDAWPRSGRQAVAADDAHPDLTGWARHGGSIAEYAPRAQVGAYLQFAFEQVAADGGAVAQIQVRRACVEAIRPVDGRHHPSSGRWLVQTTGGGPADAFDEVLLATGHGPLPGPATFDARRLAELPLPPGMTIATRGFGLTTLDLVRLLEARGAFDGGTCVHAVSRSGRPPLAKPAREVEAELRARCSPVAAGAGWPPAGALTTAFIREVVVNEASRVLRGHGPTGCDRQVRAELAEIEARTVVTPVDAMARLRRSIDAASGVARPDPATALGVAWRAMQGAVVACGSFGAFAAGELAQFRALAYALELTGFGPPLASATSLLSALEAGAVRTHSAPARLTSRGASRLLITADGDEVAIDRVIDTVLPAPGVVAGSPLDLLLEQGLVATSPDGRGVRIERDGTALRPSGRPQPGLAVIGRPTEDWVLGNDTLLRDTHDVAEQWGARVAGLAATGRSLASPQRLAAAGGAPR